MIYISETDIIASDLVIFKDIEYDLALEKINSINNNQDEFDFMLDELFTIYNPTVNLEGAEVSFKLHRNLTNLFVIKYKINNKFRSFIIDTGAQSSLLTKSLAQSLGVEMLNQNVLIGSATGLRKEMQLGVLKKFNFDKINIENLPIVIVDDNHLNIKILKLSLFKVDGIIGWDILSKLDFEIDNKNKKIRFFKSNLTTSQPNLIKGLMPIILVRDQYENLRIFGFDTGANRSWINTTLIRDLNLDVFKTSSEFIFGAHGFEKNKVQLVNEFKYYVFNKEVRYKNIRTGYTKLLNNFEFDGVIGSEILEDHKLVFINSSGLFKIDDL